MTYILEIHLTSGEIVLFNDLSQDELEQIINDVRNGREVEDGRNTYFFNPEAITHVKAYEPTPF